MMGAIVLVICESHKSHDLACTFSGACTLSTGYITGYCAATQDSRTKDEAKHGVHVPAGVSPSFLIQQIYKSGKMMKQTTSFFDTISLYAEPTRYHTASQLAREHSQSEATLPQRIVTALK